MVIINEKEYAEDCLNHGVMPCNIQTTIYMLARYYRTCFGYKPKKITSLLIEFLVERCNTYDSDVEYWNGVVEKAVSKAIKKPLCVVDGVRITKAEMNTIRDIGDTALEKLAFTLLCLAKFKNIVNPKNNNWVNYDFKEIFALARVSCKSTARGLYLNRLYEKKLVSFSKKVDNLSIQVNYICDNSDFALFVSDFRELGYEYLKYCGENYVRCGECRILIKGNKNGTRRYCKNCAGYTPIETKKMICIDCGEEFSVSSKNNRSKRCPACQKSYRMEYEREYKKVNSTQQLKDEFYLHTQKT